MSVTAKLTVKTILIAESSRIPSANSCHLQVLSFSKSEIQTNPQKVAKLKHVQMTKHWNMVHAQSEKVLGTGMIKLLIKKFEEKALSLKWDGLKRVSDDTLRTKWPA